MEHMAAPLTDTTALRAGDHRPKFWRWAKLAEHNLRRLAEDLNVSHNTIFLLMLPWADPRRLSPSVDLIAAIHALTEGEVAEGDWVSPLGDGRGGE